MYVGVLCSVVVLYTAHIPWAVASALYIHRGVPNSEVVLYTDQIAEAASNALYIEVSLIHWLYTAHA